MTKRLTDHIASDGEVTPGFTFPDELFAVIVFRNDCHFVHDQVWTVETDSKLTNHADILVLSSWIPYLMFFPKAS